MCEICYGVVDRVMVDWSESIDAQWMEALTVLEQSAHGGEIC